MVQGDVKFIVPLGWDKSVGSGSNVEACSHFVDDAHPADSVHLADGTRLVEGTHLAEGARLCLPCLNRRYGPPPGTTSLIWWNTQYSPLFADLPGQYWFDKVRYIIGAGGGCPDEAATELPKLLSASSGSLRTLEVGWDKETDPFEFSKPHDFRNMLSGVVRTFRCLSRLIVTDVPIGLDCWSDLASLPNLQTLELSFFDSIIGHTTPTNIPRPSFPSLRRLRCTLMNDCDVVSAAHIGDLCRDMDGDASRHLAGLVDLLNSVDLPRLHTFDLSFEMFSDDLRSPDELGALFRSLARSPILECIDIGGTYDTNGELADETLWPLYALRWLGRLVLWGKAASKRRFQLDASIDPLML